MAALALACSMQPGSALTERRISLPIFAKLSANWMLRGWSDVPLALVNWTTGEQRRLIGGGAYVAQCCDGRTDFDSLAFLPKHHVLLDVLMAKGMVEACHEGEDIEPWQRYRKADNPHLTGIHWCVTGRCNLSCRHCYMEAPSKRYGELPLEDMVHFIEQFERANLLGVSLTGGEPFLRNDLLDILHMLAQKRIRLVGVYSNGLLITDEHLAAIRELGFSPVFQVSFDGVGGHDYMRGTKRIERHVIDAIRRLRAAGFAVVVSTSIDRLNIGGLGDTYEPMKRLGVQTWSIAPPQEMGEWKGTTTAVSPAEEVETYSALLDRWRNDERPFNIQLAAHFKGYKLSNKSAATVLGRGSPAEPRKAPRYTPDSLDCATCRELLNLLPDGTLTPCAGYVGGPLQERMPNLLREELSSVWTQSLLRRIGDLKKKDLLARNPECVACEMFQDCGIGCRASALRQTGDLTAKDPFFCGLWKGGAQETVPTTGGARRVQELTRSPN